MNRIVGQRTVALLRKQNAVAALVNVAGPATRGFSVNTAALAAAKKKRLAEQKLKKAKKEKSVVFNAPPNPQFPLDEAILLTKALSGKNFNESIDLNLQLKIDIKKTISIRGVAALPCNTGKKEVIAVFAKDEKAKEALAAGADIVGSDDLIQRVLDGEIPFSKAIATPDMMSSIAKIARILGPRGLMPNPKVGTLTTDIAGAVDAAKRGQVEFRADKRGCVRVAFAKVNMSMKEIRGNLRAVILAIANQRPETHKGAFFHSAHLSATHSPAAFVNLSHVDSTSADFMTTWDGVPAPVTPNNVNFPVVPDQRWVIVKDSAEAIVKAHRINNKIAFETQRRQIAELLSRGIDVEKVIREEQKQKLETGSVAGVNEPEAVVEVVEVVKEEAAKPEKVE